MAKSALIELADRTFNTQKQATKFIQSILHSCALGEPIPDNYVSYVSALFLRHPDWHIKYGVGVDHFEVRNALHGTRCFYIVRTDQSIDKFSFSSCITGKAPSKKSEVQNAFRAIIQEGLNIKKSTYFRQHADANGCVKCQRTGELITKAEAHTDHVAPRTFEKLVFDFLQSISLTYDDLELSRPADMQFHYIVVDQALAEKWKQYHDEKAVLQIIKDKVNLSLGGKHRIKNRSGALPTASPAFQPAPLGLG